MREQLLGYLMGALDAEEHQDVEKQLQSSHDLRRVLDELRGHIEPLGWDHGHLEVPAGLALRTCDYVSRRKIAIPLREFSGGSARWSVQDFMVAACILVAASMLFIPAVGHSRGLARIAQCQNNLRQIGISLANYSNANLGHFPFIPETGNLATSAAFAPILKGTGHLADDRVLGCPDRGSARGEVPIVPVARQIEMADDDELRELDRTMAGHYRMTLGHYDQGNVYHPVKHRNRPHFALVSDAPHGAGQNHQSTNHGGAGQNVLFDDMHVEFLKSCRATLQGPCDDFFENESGETAPGLSENDSVIVQDRFQLPSRVQLKR